MIQLFIKTLFLIAIVAPKMVINPSANVSTQNVKRCRKKIVENDCILDLKKISHREMAKCKIESKIKCKTNNSGFFFINFIVV